MEYFETIIKTLLEHEGYWVRQSFKVNLTKQEKKQIGKPSVPRPEIDLLALKPKSQEVKGTGGTFMQSVPRAIKWSKGKAAGVGLQ